MGLLSRLFKKKGVEQETESVVTVDKDHAVVELRSPCLLAFDLPAEGVKYTIPDFEPGQYKIPMHAIKVVSGAGPSDTNLIEVDTGVIYFIDADYEDKFRDFEAQMFEETGDSYQMVENPEQFAEQIGIAYDCLEAPGIGSGYDFEGDGTYVLDLSKVERI